jgi:hypothetical protein
MEVCKRNGEATFAGMGGKEEDAPISDIRMRRSKWLQNRPSDLCLRENPFDNPVEVSR